MPQPPSLSATERERTDGFTCLAGAAAKTTRGSLHLLVTAELGALYQTQIHLQVAGATSPVIAFGDRDVILFVVFGSGTANISGRKFNLKATDGAYLRPGEAMQLSAAAGQTLQVFALACPLGELEWLERLPQNFDAQYPQRVVSVDAEQRTAMGPRYFQILVDKRIGSKVITQFIGQSPPSKAATHRHLYEEAIIVLSGEACMWTEDRRVNVRQGWIFLPRKQLALTEATSADGIDVVGVICPGTIPASITTTKSAAYRSLGSYTILNQQGLYGVFNRAKVSSVRISGHHGGFLSLVMLRGLAAAAESMPGRPEEVTVTARKLKAERVLDLPASVQAISSESLQRDMASGIMSIAGQVPGLSIQDLGPGDKIRHPRHQLDRRFHHWRLLWRRL